MAEDLTASSISSVSISSASSVVGTEIVCNMYKTSDHFSIVENKDNKKVQRCNHCNNKQYSMNTNITHLKGHVLRCSSSPLYNIQNNTFQQITKEEIDKTIVDLVIETGMSFNILDNPLFLKMARNLHYVVKLYKVPHPTTILRYLTGNIFNSRFNFIKSILAEYLR
ncbi:6638_t:CDS:1 [Dentiscutata erythropus]|uniref:6638_t:CDS:1 n=1 Tax=Dentiscutata erythropus TaxID=1348616 RepID=A0A9N9ISG5_9GLOM|nr:6638_t:CDS:1 [Dentiscutata erythropus]